MLLWDQGVLRMFCARPVCFQLGSVLSKFGICMQAARDIRISYLLHWDCWHDLDEMCKGIDPGEGRLQECLVCQVLLPIACIVHGLNNELKFLF